MLSFSILFVCLVSFSQNELVVGLHNDPCKWSEKWQSESPHCHHALILTINNWSSHKEAACANCLTLVCQRLEALWLWWVFLLLFLSYDCCLLWLLAPIVACVISMIVLKHNWFANSLMCRVCPQMWWETNVQLSNKFMTMANKW